ncbi:MAG: hypothetical protein A2163_10725 [Actinobacteria bacterium RBG_13_35_12]|jgi:hypothetical protein|nr:MAG: hypothetical protein A2163_10725 [Actinobacteria bacterium RBG_13_35_12]
MNGTDEKKASILAWASLIVGIISLVSFLGAFILGPAAAICGIIDIIRIKMGKAGENGRGMDIFGIILGIAATVMMFIMVFLGMVNYGLRYGF